MKTKQNISWLIKIFFVYFIKIKVMLYKINNPDLVLKEIKKLRVRLLRRFEV